MQCHSCDADVRDGQKFCMECGASLRGVADVTGEVPVVRAGRPADVPAPDDRTREMATVPAPPAITSAPLPPPAGRDDTLPVPSATSPWRVVEATTAAVPVTGEVPARYEPFSTAEQRVVRASAPDDVARTGWRLRPLLVVSTLALAATIIGVLTTTIEIVPPPDGTVPDYLVNDFGTNNTVAGLIAAGAMVLGALAWCFGYRWGAGLAGGSGAAVAGWAALLLGIAEWQIDSAQAGATPVTVTRDVGYWSLVAAGGLGLLVLLASLARAGRDGRSGLDPWIAALGAVSFLIAVGGPLIPEGTADWTGNYRSTTLGVELPTAFFVGRGVQIGLVALCGVVGLLSVRRYGLGLAIGGAVATGWLLATSATDQTPSPIGPGYENPGSLDLQPHAVTIVGFALVGFFALVAVVMALLDADR